MEIKDLLKFINFLKEKSNADKLIIFVGAGVSCNVKDMPDWNGLIKKMAEAIGYSKCDACKKKDAECQKTCKFKDAFSTDEYLKIPQYVYNQDTDLYNKVLLENIKNVEIDAPLSNAILNLAPSHIITTNYDNLLESCHSPQCDNYDVIISDKDLLVAQKNKYIIKMHGDIEYPDTIVLKEADYLEYSQRHVLIEMFIKALLADHTILFLGYSLNDYNIKLIISWINYIRTQNKAINSETKFGYMVLDEETVEKRQYNYFESNNIGVINIHQMPIIDKIPASLENPIGQRLYGFLKAVEDSSVMDRKLLYDEAVLIMSAYRYVSSKVICDLLNLDRRDIRSGEIVILSAINYDALTDYLNTSSENSLKLKQIFINAGISNITLIATEENRRETYKIEKLSPSLFEHKLFNLYLENQYCELEEILNTETDGSVFEACFYKSLISNYTPYLFEKYKDINFDVLSLDEKIIYLFNSSVLDAQKSFSFNNSRIVKYISGISSKRQKGFFHLYQDIFDGNNKKLLKMEQSLKKLINRYNTKQAIIGSSSLQELFNIRSIAYEQYMFYFNNTLFFKNFNDLKKILKVYIEAIICTNGEHLQVESGFLGNSSKKEKYAINVLDFDIITKFISIKDLYNMLQDYKVEQFNVNDELVDFLVESFINISRSIIELKLLHRFLDAPSTLINCAMLLSHVALLEEQKTKISTTISSLFSNDDFVEFFFAVDFPEWRISLKVITDLLSSITVREDFEIVKKIINNKNFKEYYVNSNTNTISTLLSCFIGDRFKHEDAQRQIQEFINLFDGKERIQVLRLLRKHVVSENIITEQKNFITENFDNLNSEDILDFAFNDWLHLSDETIQKILNKANELYAAKIPGRYSYPDPLETQLELICILYITGKIDNLEKVAELSSENEFIAFFIDESSFDYSKVDLSNYMWQNIARQPRFLKVLKEHKESIIPGLKRKVDLDMASDFEKKLLYGAFLSEDELIEF